jgi:hypothetical protein
MEGNMPKLSWKLLTKNMAALPRAFLRENEELAWVTNSALTGATYDIHGGQQLMAG